MIQFATELARQAYKERQAKKKKVNREAIIKHIQKLRQSSKCSKCDTIGGLQFHHFESRGGNRKLTIRFAAFSGSWTKLQRELAKGEWLCHTCHVATHNEVTNNGNQGNDSK